MFMISKEGLSHIWVVLLCFYFFFPCITMSRFPLVPMFSTLSSNFSVDLTGNLGYSFPTKKGRQIFSSSARLEKKRFCWSVFAPLKSHFLSTLPSLSYSVVRRGKKARVHQHRAQCWLVFMLLLIGMLSYSCAYLSLSSELFCRALPTPFRKQNFFFSRWDWLQRTCCC